MRHPPAYARTAADAHSHRYPCPGRYRAAGRRRYDGDFTQFDFTHINGLTPRQQIRYFYLSTVQRAADRGVARAESETPLEYMADLQEQRPEAAEELDTLTNAFLKARYGRQELQKEEANRVKKRWKTVKRLLKK